MNQILNIEEEQIVNLREWWELQSIIDAIQTGRPIHKPDIDFLEKLAKSISETHHHQLQRAREESGKEMFNRIKADITKLEYETDGDTFKKIVLSRLSSLAWFDALHHSELDQDKALQDKK